jgi:hypothetical protein
VPRCLGARHESSVASWSRSAARRRDR